MPAEKDLPVGVVNYDQKHCYLVIGNRLEFVHMQHYKDVADTRLYGSFDTRDEALVEWKRLSMSTIDDAHMKYQIVKVY